MTFAGLLAVGGGIAIGAWLRRWLGILLNPIFRTAPLGAIAANTLRGLLLGFAMTAFSYYQPLPPEVRLLVSTGFLGRLTTFSTLLGNRRHSSCANSFDGPLSPSSRIFKARS